LVGLPCIVRNPRHYFSFPSRAKRGTQILRAPAREPTRGRFPTAVPTARCAPPSAVKMRAGTRVFAPSKKWLSEKRKQKIFDIKYFGKINKKFLKQNFRRNLFEQDQDKKLF
jgi:hypothetical protein